MKGPNEESNTPHDANILMLQRWGLYALVVLLPFSVFWPVGRPIAPAAVPLYVTPALYLSDFAVGVILLTGLLSKGDQRRPAGWSLPLLALAVLGLLTVPLALSSTLAFYTASRWLLAAALYLALSQSDAPMKRVVVLFLAGLAVQALVGLGQVIRQEPLGFPGELALAANQAGAAIIEVNRARWVRAYGLTFHPNVLGGFLVVGLLLALPLVGQRWVRLLWVVLWFGILITFSRSSWVAALATVPLAMAWLGWRRPAMRGPLASALFGAALAVVIGMTLWPQQTATRWQPLLSVFQSVPTEPNPLATAPTERVSLDARATMNRLAWELIKKRPLMGFGAGNFPLVMARSEQSIAPQFAHNVPLLLSAEVGLLGGVVWSYMALVAVGQLLRGRRTLNSWGVVTRCAWLALCIVSLVDSYPWALESGRLLTVLVLGLSDRDSDLP